MMNALQTSIERLRPLVGMKGWDYCVLWKLRDDQKCIEWMGCCCGGAESAPKGEEHLFPVSPIVPCRDVMFQHPRTKACDLLAELPSSMPLDSGIHTQALISSHPKWINLPNISDSIISDEAVGTRVFIPVPGGLVELFVAKKVLEEQHITEFVMAQCKPSWEQEAMLVRADIGFNGPCLNHGFTGDDPINHPPEPFPSNGYETKSNTNHFQQWITPTNDNSSLPWDLSIDQIRLCNSPMNIFSGTSLPPTDDRPKNDIFLEGSLDSIHKPPSFNSAMDDGFPDMSAMQRSIGIVTPNLHPSLAESSVTKELGHDKDSIKQEMGRGDSISDCSDQMEDDDGHKAVGRSGRRHPSKNLHAERRRRKKLNDRLYLLRSLVPKISKMDRASILGDAIEFVKELKKQEKDLQDELEETPEDEEQKDNCNNHDNVQLEVPNQNVSGHGDGESPNGLKTMTTDQGTRCSSSDKTGDLVKHNHDSMSTEDKAHQMEAQVEVSQVSENEFFLKVFWEPKRGGFVRLMEAINSLGLEVTNANVTTFGTLVMNVFKVEKRDNEVVQADQVRDSLLELTRNPNGGWPASGHVGENGGSDYLHHQHHHQHQHHQHHQHGLNSHHNPHHLHHLHHQS
ncbi:hypothetical protein AAC387_Pa11g1185 [Persea americana]